MVIKFTCLWTCKHANYECVLESVNGGGGETKKKRRNGGNRPS